MNKKINSFIISDCADDNAKSRYVASFSRELGGFVNCVAVKNSLEGSGCAIDIIDELRGKEALVFLNVALRANRIKDEGHKNGRPFCYFKVGKTVVIASLKPEIFELFKKVGIDFKKLKEIDLFKEKGVPQNTQFRSAQCIPIVARKIFSNKTSAYKEVKNFEVGDISDSIWWVDNFGNCKTTLTSFTDKVKYKKIERLTDVKDGETAQTIGSSGFKDKRFVEFVIGADSYAKANKTQTGQRI